MTMVNSGLKGLKELLINMKITNVLMAKFLTGLFYLVKLPCINSLICHMPETLDLAFKLRKKKFMIEVIIKFC